MDTEIMNKQRQAELESYTIEEIQAYLKTKGLGTFNLSLDFHYYQDAKSYKSISGGDENPKDPVL